jgi:D-serine deaminase-like pyridoxal phosphate-dependent protein
MEPTYQNYRELLGNECMPFAFVDLDLFDENIRQLQRRASGKRIRVASKSVRCVPLLERILNAGGPFQGLMCYSAREAAFLAHQGFDDLLLGYPVWNDLEHSGLIETVRRGTKVTIMVDCEEHVERAERVAAEFHVPLRLCLDVDMSTEFPRRVLRREAIAGARRGSGATDMPTCCNRGRRRTGRRDGLRSRDCRVCRTTCPAVGL